MTEHNKNLTAAQMLLDARTSGRRKREVSTISKLLCIREEYLTALENGDYHKIPEVVYILGFARNYAMELGLDPDEIVYKIKEELGLINENENLDVAVDEEDKNVPDTPEKTAKPAKPIKKSVESDALENLSKYIYKNWKLLLCLVVLLGIVVAGVTFVMSLDDKANIETPIVETVTDATNDPEFKQEVRERFGTENRANAKVILQAVQDTWVSIKDARGNTVMERTLLPGDVYYVPAGDKYRGTFGKAGSLDVWVDGVFAPKMGAPNAYKSGVSLSPAALMGTETADAD